MRAINWTTIALIFLVPLGACAGNADVGKEKAAPCAACHNPDKLPLAGKDAGDLEAAMKAIRAGDIAHPPTLNDLTDQDLADIAAYLSSS